MKYKGKYLTSILCCTLDTEGCSFRFILSGFSLYVYTPIENVITSLIRINSLIGTDFIRVRSDNLGCTVIPLISTSMVYEITEIR